MDPAEDGYGVKTGYTYGYYRRLSPTWLKLAAAIYSIELTESDQFRYFELGFGQGVSLNIHAAANRGEFWGTDYNPEHVNSASRMADASGAAVHLLDLSFDEIALRDDLPKFNVIVAHGIWSWISESSRAAVIRFVDKNLAPGGLLYLSYNSLPGSASGVAIQKLIRALTHSMATTLSETERFDRARECIKGLEDATSGHFQEYPKAHERLLNILTGSSAYYLHEYTVSSWEPMLLSDVAETLNSIGLSFLGSADLESQNSAHQILDIGSSLTSRESRGTLTPVLLETIRDFEFDRRFRADLFVRSPFMLHKSERDRRLYAQRFALTAHPDQIETIAVDVSFTENERLCRAILNSICNRPEGTASVNDISTSMAEVQQDRILQGLMQCANLGVVHPVQHEAGVQGRNRTRALNRYLSAHVAIKSSKRVVASPLTGSGVPAFDRVPEFEAAMAKGGSNIAHLLDVVSENPLPNRLRNYSAVEVLKEIATYTQRWHVANVLKI